ncbi:DUF4398 domain-containing protein [Rhodanobacter sp. Root179]|uniref:DUF4398 domain-containing protein n=1 Tax=Rhodanobacter sp. Root179 TaxID=1736482 RepID=UPI0006F9A3CB|nr:DUF4398 domain-containing protein [Rhodanobacter sp. Root179]KRB42075.1 hypothetical protein ASD82_08285 [Rhodanobacter sp. Root179]
MHIFSLPAGHFRPGRTVLIALVLALFVAGCASVPPPNDSMNMAQTQLQMARDAGAADYAPVDLGFAQDKFQLAQSAMAERKYADAASLAEESRADAELAQAKARLGAARAQIQSKMKENSRLRAQGEAAAAAAQAPAPAPPASNAQPTEDMPAPPSSALSTPAGDGFQTVPDNAQQPAVDPAGGQP